MYLIKIYNTVTFIADLTRNLMGFRVKRGMTGYLAYFYTTPYAR